MAELKEPLIFRYIVSSHQLSPLLKNQVNLSFQNKANVFVTKCNFIILFLSSPTYLKQIQRIKFHFAFKCKNIFMAEVKEPVIS